MPCHAPTADTRCHADSFRRRLLLLLMLPLMMLMPPLDTRCCCIRHLLCWWRRRLRLFRHAATRCFRHFDRSCRHAMTYTFHAWLDASSLRHIAITHTSLAIIFIFHYATQHYVTPFFSSTLSSSQYAKPPLIICFAGVNIIMPVYAITTAIIINIVNINITLNIVISLSHEPFAWPLLPLFIFFITPLRHYFAIYATHAIIITPYYIH